jgi:hypothetical protein
MNLEETVAFVESREIGRRDVQSLSEGPSSIQVNAVIILGRCWRCNEAHIRKNSCKAFNATWSFTTPAYAKEEGRGGHGKLGASHAQHHGRHQHQPVPVQSLRE